MNFVTRAAKKSPRLVVFCLLISIFSVFATAAVWNDGFGWLVTTAESASSLSGERKTVEDEMLVDKPDGGAGGPGVCESLGNIEVHAAAGTLTAGYAELNSAFAQINNGTHQGSITIDVCGSTTETASAILNSGAVAPASYTDGTIRPVGGARIIEGSIVGAIIKLNGADNVTIDGRLNGVGASRDLTVRNNSAADLTAAVWLSSVAAGNGASNNVVRNLEIATGIDASAVNTVTFGILMSGTTLNFTSNGVDNDNNSFIANRVVKARYGIVTRGSSTDFNINPVVTDNIIGPEAFGSDQISKTGIFMQRDTGALVSRNIVQSVACLEPQACATVVDPAGIVIGNDGWSATDSANPFQGANYTVTRNTIRNIVSEIGASAVGIKLGTHQSGGATNNLLANNFIYNIRSNGVAGEQPVGIGINGGNGDGIVNNSISLTGDMDPGLASAPSTYGSAINILGPNGVNNANLLIQNNSIYLNAFSSGSATVRYYAITLDSAAFSFGTGGLNYNNYYFDPNNSRLRTGGLGFSNDTTTTEFLSLANWKTALTTPQDANSIQADPLYNSVTGDLHITSLSPNINAGTTIAGVTVDFDNEARPNGANYDIGADEFYSNSGVLQLSSTTYSELEGSTAVISVNRLLGSAGAVSVTATITDGTATGGAACTPGVDYINPGTQVVTFNEAETLKTISVQLCTDAPLTDPAETFTVTLSAPTGGAALGTPTTATVTITDVPAPFSGTYTVGAAGTYPSLTNPGGIFEAMNLAGATGPVTIQITFDLTGETGTHCLNEIVGSPAITIKPAGAPRTISGSSSGAIIKLCGADNVTVNGSTTGALVGGNPALRELTVQNTGTGAIFWLATNDTSGATGNTIKNVRMVGPGNFSGQGIVAGSGSALLTSAENDRPNSGNSILNNSAIGVQNAVLAGGSSVTFDNNWLIAENDFGSAVTAEKLSQSGITLQWASNFTIRENRISGVNSSPTSAASMTGIYLSGDLSNGSVTRNEIKDIRHNVASRGSQGMYLFTNAAVANATVANNFISDVSSFGSNTTAPLFNGHGIVVQGGGFRIYHNTIVMNTNQVDAAGHSACVYIAGAIAVTVNMRDNIFVNSQTVGNRYLVFKEFVTLTVFAALGFNNYWSPTGANIARQGGVNYTTLAAWQAATGLDANSVNLDPLFRSATDFHLQAASPVRNIGTPIAEINIDFDGNPRPNPSDAFVVQVDIGADEFLAPTAANAELSGRVTTANGEGIRNATVMLLGGTLTEPVYAQTGSFGNYRFENLPVGQTYVVTVISKRYTFAAPSRIVTLNDNAGDENFEADSP